MVSRFILLVLSCDTALRYWCPSIKGPLKELIPLNSSTLCPILSQTINLLATKPPSNEPNVSRLCSYSPSENKGGGEEKSVD